MVHMANRQLLRAEAREAQDVQGYTGMQTCRLNPASRGIGLNLVESV